MPDDRTVYYDHPDIIFTLPGTNKIEVFIPPFNFVFRGVVSHKKGFGTYDWIKLKGKPLGKKYHEPLLRMLVSQDVNELNKIWSSREIQTKMKIIMHIQRPTYFYTESHWQRPISEFLGLGILFHPGTSAWPWVRLKEYQLNRELARTVLRNGKFNE